ncbi:putative protein kinase-like domain superfamily [Helianthus debilis subsp. tardiflorus]
MVWGHWYTLRELEEATNGFSDWNVIGEGGYGIVYSDVYMMQEQGRLNQSRGPKRNKIRRP